MSEYNHEQIETSIQENWQKKQMFTAKEDLSREKFYCLSMLPYPSGELHMGHVRNYTLADVIARYQTMLGKNVLQPMGWDAFGLPAENAALKHGLPPHEWTYKNIDLMRKQFKRLGFAIDWTREFATCEPSYYRWEQWLFIQLYKKGLVYRKNSVVNWDPVDQTVLANEQVVNGCGWRSGAPVEQRTIPQWFIKITAYADELLEDLAKLDGWPEQVKTMQRNWIGRSEGLEIEFKLPNPQQSLKIYTTRPDTLLGATYLAIAPQHPLALLAATEDDNIAAFIEKCKNIKVAEAELATIEKQGFATPFVAEHPITGEPIPIWVANYVLMEYGSGAVMAVPAHDERDFEFAKQYQLPMKIVIQPEQPWDFAKQAYTGEGTMVNSADYDGMPSNQAREQLSDDLESRQQAIRKTNYRLRDWGVSRQRYWGTPIPIVYCSDCGDVPVPEEQLPVVLPQDLTLNDPASPLKTMPEFYKTSCPNCRKPAKRETDTFDTFVESSWYYLRYACPDQHESMLDDRAQYWTPVDQYIGGIEHAVMHLLYARFFHKLLRDEGLINSDEPFARLMTQGMVLKDGAKMSKSKGNTVSPSELINRYGADTVRLFSMFAAPPEQSLEWSDSGVEGCYRFLKRLYQHAGNLPALKNTNAPDWAAADNTLKQLRREMHQILAQADNDMQRLQFNTVVSAAMKLFNIINKLDPNQQEQLALINEGYQIILPILAPITPHLCQYLWQQLGLGNTIYQAPWPKVDQKALDSDSVTLVVQVNGKLRGQIDVNTGADEDSIKQAAQTASSVVPHLADKTVRRIIIVPGRLVNIVAS